MAKPVRITSRFLNAVNDAVPASTEFDRTGGQLGSIVEYPTNADALKVSKTSVGTLRAGKYMYVRTLSGSSASPAVGVVAFVNDLDNFIVSPDGGATLDGRVAGIYISAPDKGNRCWIQVQGDATVLCKASVTGTTIAELAIVTTTANTVDSVTDATADATAGTAKRVIGKFLEAAASGALKRISLQNTVYANRSAR